MGFDLQQDPGVGGRTEGRRKQHEVTGDLRTGGERVAIACCMHFAVSRPCWNGRFVDTSACFCCLSVQ